jgi:multidrug efflux system outer membrane protein
MNKLHMIAKGVAPILALLMTACAAPEFKQPAMDADGIQGIAST